MKVGLGQPENGVIPSQATYLYFIVSAFKRKTVQSILTVAKFGFQVS